MIAEQNTPRIHPLQQLGARLTELLEEDQWAECEALLLAGGVRPYQENNAKRIYISGPMTGIQDFNFPAFHAEADRLRALGYDVVNPAELNPDTTMGWHECMRSDLAALLTCDTLALMDGWQKSAGAHLEMHVAHRVGMEIVIAQEIAA